MQSKEASDKLALYAERFGDWVLDLSPDTLRAIGQGRRATYARRGGGSANLRLLSEAVQFNAMADCLEVIQRG